MSARKSFLPILSSRSSPSSYRLVDPCPLRRRTCRLSRLPVLRAAGPEGLATRIHGRPPLGMLTALTLGLTLWIVYGAIKGVWVIVGSNVVGAALAGAVLGCKLRDRKCHSHKRGTKP